LPSATSTSSAQADGQSCGQTEERMTRLGAVEVSADIGGGIPLRPLA
jgi:hypothetical protein